MSHKGIMRLKEVMAETPWRLWRDDEGALRVSELTDATTAVRGRSVKEIEPDDQGRRMFQTTDSDPTLTLREDNEG